MYFNLMEEQPSSIFHLPSNGLSTINASLPDKHHIMKRCCLLQKWISIQWTTNCCRICNLLPDSALVRRMAILAWIPWSETLWLFLMYCQTWVFYARTAYGRGFFFITMEFFDASPSFVPKTSLTQPKKKKTKEGGGYMSDSPTARRTNILVNT